MKHYDEVEWKLYKRGLLNKNIKQMMEDHLLQCDSCMDMFLSLIDEEEVSRAGKLISHDFNENLMEDIVKVIPLERVTKKNKSKKTSRIYNEILIYYTAIASVAIFLTGIGFFNKVVERVPDISSNIQEEKFSINTYKINEFSKSVTRATANFANSFKFDKEEN